MISEEHDGDADQLPNTHSQILITSRNDVALVLCYSVCNAIIGICAFMCASQSLKTAILDDFQRKSKFASHLLQFTQNAVGDVRNCFGIQTVHESLHHVDFVLNRKVDEIRVYDNMKWWTKLTVIPQEQCGRNSRHFGDLQLLTVLLLLTNDSIFLFDSTVRLLDPLLENISELSGLLCTTHF